MLISDKSLFLQIPSVLVDVNKSEAEELSRDSEQNYI